MTLVPSEGLAEFIKLMKCLDCILYFSVQYFLLFFTRFLTAYFIHELSGRLKMLICPD